MPIKKGEVNLLWDSMENKSWNELLNTVDVYLNLPEWEENENFLYIRDFAELRLVDPFPTTSDDLYQMLNDQINQG